jgi:hypothetical protein
MPRIQLVSADGMYFSICTRQTETILRAWFDEVLPYTYVPGRPGIDDFEVLWPRVMITPMWALKVGCAPTDPDWPCDSRVTGRMEELPARNGDEGLAELAALRRRLEADLAAFKDR